MGAHQNEKQCCIPFASNVLTDQEQTRIFPLQLPRDIVVQARHHKISLQEIPARRYIVDTMLMETIRLIVDPEGQVAGACLGDKLFVHLDLDPLSDLRPAASIRLAQIAIVDIGELQGVLVGAVGVEFGEGVGEIQLESLGESDGRIVAVELRWRSSIWIDFVPTSLGCSNVDSGCRI